MSSQPASGYYQFTVAVTGDSRLVANHVEVRWGLVSDAGPSHQINAVILSPLVMLLSLAAATSRITFSVTVVFNLFAFVTHCHVLA